MYEPTFELDNFGKTRIYEGIQALSIRVYNVLVNRKFMLPNNPGLYADLKQYFMEYSSPSGLDQMKVELLNTIKYAIPEGNVNEVDVNIQELSSGNKNIKTIFITIKVGSVSSNNSSIVYAMDLTKTSELEFKQITFN